MEGENGFSKQQRTGGGSTAVSAGTDPPEGDGAGIPKNNNEHNVLVVKVV